MKSGKGSRISLLARKISETSEFLLLKAEVRDLVYSYRITGSSHEFTPHHVFSDVHVSFSAEGNDLVEKARVFQTNDIYWELTLNPVVKSERLKCIIDQYKGVIFPGDKKARIPSYFCNTDSVMEELLMLPEGYFMPYSEFNVLRRKIKQDILGFIASPQFHSELEQARDEYAVMEIKNVLTRFKGISEHTLKRAVQEFIVEDIMSV